MHNLKLTIAYDGTRYHGWQVQPGVPTIQGEIEQALSRILDRPARIHGAGRTDRGVHASGQVAHCLPGKPVGPATVAAGLNALLPPDIRIRSVAAVRPEFHARYSALSRTYRYRIARNRVVDPFRYRWVHAVWGDLDGDAMEEAAGRLVGEHDFTALASDPEPEGGGTREVYEASWSRGAGEWVFTIRASGFLRAMVRTIVGTLLEVGSERRPLSDIERILAGRDRAAAGPTAPASGLELAQVAYHPFEEGSQDEQLFTVKW